MKRLIISSACILAACITIFMTGCEGDNPESSATSNASAGASNTTAPSSDTEVGEEYIEGIKISTFDKTATWDESSAVKINMNGTGADIQGTGASVDGKIIKISFEGTYILSGALDDGQILVEVEKTEKVQLVLNGVSVTCSDSAPLYIKSADKVSITLVDGTENTFTDSGSYVYADGVTKPNACIYSSEDLVINGTGKLTVNANYNNGIGSKNDLKIMSGTINVTTAVNNGLKGNDRVVIKDGNITIKCDNDGIKSDNEVDAEKGAVYIFGGTIDIDSGDDCIQAYTNIKITGGNITVKYEGKALNCETQDVKEGSIIEK